MNWIDVNEELPPNNTECVVWVKNATWKQIEGFERVIFNSEYFKVSNNRFVNYENGGEYETDYTEFVTHWMIPMKPCNTVISSLIPEKTILDACCGSRMFWFDKQNPDVLFIDKRSETLTAKDSGSKTGVRVIDVKPDLIADFTDMPFENNSFWMVVFDPPHLKTLGETSWMAKKYGRLPKNWESMIKKGFDECMRVLKPNGTLIFKWNESEIMANEILKLIPYKPLFGHTTGRQSKTIWMAFMKKM